MKRIIILSVMALLTVFLIHHSSVKPQVFGRYSYQYFLLLIIYLTSILIFLIKIHFKIPFTGFKRLFIKYNYLIIFLFFLVCAGTRFTKDIFSDKIILQFDYPLHLYQTETAKINYETTGSTAGYDPFFMAGYPSGTFLDISTKWIETLAIIFDVNTNRLFKLCILTVYLLVPFMLLLSSYHLDLSYIEKRVFFIIGIFILLTGKISNIFLIYGMYSFVTSSFIIFAAIILFLSYAVNNSRTGLYLSAVLFILSSYIYPVLFIISLPPLVILLILLKKIKKVSFLILIILLNIAVLFPVYKKILDFYMFKTNAAIFFQTNDIIQILKKTFLFEGLDISTFVFLTGVCGLFIMFINKERKYELKLHSVFAGWFLVISFFGSKIKLIGNIEPLRYSLLAELFLIYPAVYFIKKSVVIFNLKRRSFSEKIIIYMLAWLICSYPFIGYLYRYYFHPERAKMLYNKPEYITGLVDFIDKLDHKNKFRILVDDSSGQFRIPVILNVLCKNKVNFVGGPIATSPILHHYVSYQNGILFNKSIMQYDLGQFINICELYNIKWFIIRPTFKIKEKLDSLNTLLTLKKKIKYDNFSNFYIYEVNITPSFINLSVPHKINIENNVLKMTFDNKIPEQFILKFHWSEYFVPENCKIERMNIMNSPIGFIKVYDITDKNIKLKYRYKTF